MEQLGAARRFFAGVVSSRVTAVRRDTALRLFKYTIHSVPIGFSNRGLLGAARERLRMSRHPHYPWQYEIVGAARFLEKTKNTYRSTQLPSVF